MYYLPLFSHGTFLIFLSVFSSSLPSPLSFVLSSLMFVFLSVSQHLSVYLLFFMFMLCHFCILLDIHMTTVFYRHLCESSPFHLFLHDNFVYVTHSFQPYHAILFCLSFFFCSPSLYLYNTTSVYFYICLAFIFFIVFGFGTFSFLFYSSLSILLFVQRLFRLPFILFLSFV